RPFDFQAAARPPQAEPISAVGTYESASVSPSQPDQSPPRGRPDLAGKSCFPTEVRSKLPELPARNSPSFLHQIDRVVEVHRIHHRATLSLRASKSGRGKKVIFARHLPGVGHAQDLARIPNLRLSSLLELLLEHLHTPKGKSKAKTRQVIDDLSKPMQDLRSDLLMLVEPTSCLVLLLCTGANCWARPLHARSKEVRWKCPYDTTKVTKSTISTSPARFKILVAVFS
ncbi:cellulose synthase-like B4, partial [Prunus dulcis]